MVLLVWRLEVDYVASMVRDSPPHSNRSSTPENTIFFYIHFILVESSWNVMAHGGARKGKWRGNWQMEWVASTLHTTSEHGVPSITTTDAHTSAASSQLNWLLRWFKWTHLVSVHVPSRFKRSLVIVIAWKIFRSVTGVPCILCCNVSVLWPKCTCHCGIWFAYKC